MIFASSAGYSAVAMERSIVTFASDFSLTEGLGRHNAEQVADPQKSIENIYSSLIFF